MGEFAQYDAEAPATLEAGGSRDASQHLERSQDSGARVCRKGRGLIPIEGRRRPADPNRYDGGGRTLGGVRNAPDSEAVRHADPVEFAGVLAEEIPAVAGFKALGLASAAAFDSLRQPLLDLALEPAHSTLTEFDSLGEALFRLHPINHRPT